MKNIVQIMIFEEELVKSAACPSLLSQKFKPKRSAILLF
jgi:hypothetical protein